MESDCSNNAVSDVLLVMNDADMFVVVGLSKCSAYKHFVSCVKN